MRAAYRCALSQMLLLRTNLSGLPPLLTPAHAEDATPATPPPAEIVVTGSRLPQTKLTSISPITTVGAQDIATQGATRIEDVLNGLPQVTGAQSTGTIGSAGTGTATVNLRNLGEQRTLVLMNGARLAPGGYFPGNNASASAADLNLIPATLIDRVEVLTGGASAVYGADAVAGVVNFVMKTDFEGVRLTTTGSGYEHDQREDYIQSIVRGANQPLPKSSMLDGGTVDVNFVAGKNFSDSRGNAGSGGQYFTVLVHLEAFLMLMGANVMFRFLKVAQFPETTVETMVKMTRAFVVTPFDVFEFMEDLGLIGMTTLGKRYSAALDTLESKEDYIALTGAMMTYVIRLHRWIHFIFPWNLGVAFLHRTMADITAMAALLPPQVQEA